ncbi:beta-defensin 1 [Meriones unguiculatus]|uniref:beta-defensin 1 n=1 Tax=Meriones unguiculatus TaxID=10047 RepID=UPI000B4EBA3B|nr:beta-defensin 1 [Meriones unguiculatus]
MQPGFLLKTSSFRPHMSVQVPGSLASSLHSGPTATAMKTYYFLLVIFFLFSQMEPGAGVLTSLGHRTDQYRCLKNGGFCLRSSCPLNTRLQGTCKPDKPNCCYELTT